MNKFLKDRLKLTCGDITKIETDAIVNAANSALTGGGGVDGAIHAAAGPGLLAECLEIRKHRYPDGMPAGKAVATGSGKLPHQGIIHTVGPIWRGGANKEAGLLASAYRSCLQIAGQIGFKSLAFPAISTGVYGFPKEYAAKIVYQEMREYLAKKGLPREVVLVFFNEEDLGIFIKAIKPDKRRI